MLNIHSEAIVVFGRWKADCERANERTNERTIRMNQNWKENKNKTTILYYTVQLHLTTTDLPSSGSSNSQKANPRVFPTL